MYEENVYCSEMNVFKSSGSVAESEFLQEIVYTIPMQFRDFGRGTAALIL